MFEKRIVIGKLWFKLPFHELEDRKPLWENVEANKTRMKSLARWYKELDIYVERDWDVIAEEESRNVGVQDEGMNVGAEEADMHDRAEIECEKLCEKLVEKNAETGLMFGDNEDEASDPLCDPLAEESDDGRYAEDDLSESSESNDDAEVVEEDVVVLDNVNYEEQIPDKEEFYPVTDDSSGDKEEQADRLAKRGLPDGVFSLRQLFRSGTEFKKNVISYILKTRRNVEDLREKLGLRDYMSHPQRRRLVAKEEYHLVSPETREKRRRLSKQGEKDAQEAAVMNAQDEANDEAQETAEMEADLAAQMVDQVEVKFISSTAPQPSQPSQGNQVPQRNLRRSTCLTSLLFG
ncbi:hypothetical protein DY000_02016431 [Brassica cretica]|uniref:Uncharacterized protein n=1 Tax=Brassica cretica TaxID=69181 RepID=A0ABQ7CW38_BRACR|nr:hypothetical protein DY000_02016431 [Brassica cretica]